MSHTIALTRIAGWRITASADGSRLYLSRDDRPGEIHVKATPDGYEADLWSDEDAPDRVATAAAPYTALAYRDIEMVAPHLMGF